MTRDYLPQQLENMRLTAEQQYWWSRYFHYRQAVKPGDEQMAVRHLAAEMIAQSPENRITVGGRLLRQFGVGKDLVSKSDYIQEIKTSRTWGDDATLKLVVDKLGYQPVMHVPKLLPYVPFTQANYRRRIDVTCNGTHWELVEKSNNGRFTKKSNPGGGDCMYHTLAQQFEKDAPAMQEAVKRETVVAHVVEENAVAREVEQRWQPSNPVVNEVVQAWLNTVKGNPKETFSYLLFYLANGDMNFGDRTHREIFAKTINAMNSRMARNCFERARDSSVAIAKTETGGRIAEMLLQRMNPSDRAQCQQSVAAAGLFKKSCRAENTETSAPQATKTPVC